MDRKINNFLDELGLVKVWPGKQKNKLLVLEYLSTKFDYDRDYKETEVNNIIKRWHTFNDYFLLRRELIDRGFLGREPDGSRYWRVKQTAFLDNE